MENEKISQRTINAFIAVFKDTSSATSLIHKVAAVINFVYCRA